MSKADTNQIKPSFDEHRQKLGEVLPLRVPFNVLLDSSEVCNFRCNYCFRADKDKSVWGYAKDNNLMDWETFVRAVEQVKEFEEPVKQISLSGHGEPLCNRMLPKMVSYIKSAGVADRVSIHTNGSLLDEKYVYELIDSEIDRIVVSLQGMNAEKYIKVCGAKIDVDHLFDTLSLLYRKKRNTKLYIKIADAALEPGEEEMFYKRVLSIADRAYVEKIVPIWKGTEYSNKQIQTMTQNKYGTVFQKQNCCPVLFHSMFVTPGGDVYPCTQLTYPKPLGNVRDLSLKQMWESEERKRLLRNQLNLICPDICAGCYIKDNSIFTQEDMIDDYREEILKRLI